MWNHLKIIRIIKEHIPLGLKLVLIRILVFTQTVYYGLVPKATNEKISKSKQTIFVLLSTDYSNLGDHAMTYAHIKLVEKEFPKAQVIEVLVGDTLKSLRYIEKNIKPNDIITLKGGGNIGIQYFREELIRRKIISVFNNNKIILFPQTVYFPNTKVGNKELSNTVKCFKEHGQFYMFFRDKYSYNLMNKFINKNIFITPDIVFSLGKMVKNDQKRNGVVTCLRSDVEGIYTEDQKAKVIDLLKEKFNDVAITDTIKDYFIKTCEREEELNKCWNLFRGAELIVTDRLHGMIFAALTETPCIVFKTYNHKLTGQYEWISDLDYIKNITMDKIEVDEAVDVLLNSKSTTYNKDFDKYFKQIIRSMKV